MRNVRVSKNELLAKVKANREAHRGIFLKALEGYRTEAIAQLEKMLEEAKSRKRIRGSIELEEPMDMTREYDRVISMLEMSEDDTIELTNSEFAQYVLDDWSWKHQFGVTNSKYLVS